MLTISAVITLWWQYMRFNRLKFELKRLAADESGATAVEYAILATCLSIAIIMSFDIAWTAVKDKFIWIAGFLNSTNP